MEGVQDKKMKFTVATNFDPEVIEEITKYNENNIFESVFGKLQKDVVGGGRSSLTLPNITMSELEDHVNLCHENGLEFNYLLNPLCLENREYKRKEHKKIVKLLNDLANVGVDKVTINSPFLCQLIKKRFPFKITIGQFSYVHTIQQVKYWEELGADEVTLPQTSYRNFNLLEKMLMHTKKSGIALRIIANNFCLHNCPFTNYHSTELSHSSDLKQKFNQIHIDYSLINCTYLKIKNPAKFIASDWIRPEDIKYYDELCEKTGNYNFSIKLVERTKTSEFLKRVIKAYATRSFEGNLMDILNWTKGSDINQVDKKGFILSGITGLYNMKTTQKYSKILYTPSIYIDNQKLDGFFGKFVNDNDCNSKVCNDLSDTEESGKSPLSCSYCRNWAEKAVSWDEDEVNDWIYKAESFFDDLNDSKLFR